MGERCGSGTAVASVQHLRGAGGRCDSVGVFCEGGVDARRGVDSGSLAEVGVMGTTGEWRVREERFVGERMVPLSQALWPLGAAPTSCFVT